MRGGGGCSTIPSPGMSPEQSLRGASGGQDYIIPYVVGRLGPSRTPFTRGLVKYFRALRGKSRDGKSGRDGTGTGTVAIFPFPTGVSRPLPLLIYVPAFPVPSQDELFPSYSLPVPLSAHSLPIPFPFPTLTLFLPSHFPLSVHSQYIQRYFSCSYEVYDITKYRVYYSV